MTTIKQIYLDGFIDSRNSASNRYKNPAKVCWLNWKDENKDKLSEMRREIENIISTYVAPAVHGSYRDGIEGTEDATTEILKKLGV